MKLSPEQRAQFVRSLMAWYRIHARRLPWRGVSDPYYTWLSEIMLQQTRVNAVIDHFQRFLVRFPTIVSLALAPEPDVLALWSGLGYYRRARMLHRAAQLVMQEHGGSLPTTAVGLRRLPGVGNYTSAAVASIAFGEQVAVVDGNVERVLLRVMGQPERPGAEAAEEINALAQSLVPARKPGDHNQAMMELGATVCLPRAPLCDQCPIYTLCLTRGEHTTIPRARMKSERVSYALCTRKGSGGIAVEVLLQRRPPDISLMAGMLELPQMDSAEVVPGDTAFALTEEPVLRVRHAIVGTNYYVEIFTLPNRREVAKRALRQGDFSWEPLTNLTNLPLTGLARKALQRLQLMKAPAAERAPAVPLLIGRASRVQTGDEA